MLFVEATAGRVGDVQKLCQSLAYEMLESIFVGGTPRWLGLS